MVAFLHLRWILPDLRGEGLGAASAAAEAAAISVWPQLTAVPLGGWVVSESPGLALVQALDLIGAHNAHTAGFGFSVGIGVGRLGSSDSLRATRLAAVALPAEVLLTSGFVGVVPAPEGIGWFRAPSFQESLAGFLCHRAADYRG